MPATAIELQSSRQYNHNKGKPTAVREFIVIDAASEADVLALFGSTLPQQNDYYPNTSAFIYDLVARDFSIQKVPEHPQAFRISFTYEPEGNIVPANVNPFSTDKEPGEIGYRTAQASTRAEFADFWRAVTFVDALLYAETGVPDLLQNPLDTRGIPVSRLVQLQEISITVVDQELPNPLQIRQTLGARNSARFLGYDKGFVLFSGFDGSIQPETGNTQASFKFLYSSLAHLVQQPDRTSLGDVKTNNDSGSIYYGKAATVALVQPYTLTADFNSLSPHFSGL